jgi:hypothetical protein
MRKRFVLMLCVICVFFSFLGVKVKAQVHNGNLTLNTQAEADAFNFTEVNGVITISGTSITNLNGLSELTKCNSLLISSNPNLTNIIGLANLQEVKDDLIIRNNDALTSLAGLSSLTFVGTAPPDALVIENNDMLLSIDGLFNLTFAHSLRIILNERLENVNGLSALTEVEDFFTISNNSHLTSLQGLSNFTKVSSMFGHFTLDNNDALITLDGLSGVNELAGLIVRNNGALINLDGLSNLDDINFGGLIIENNAVLTNINGLSNISSLFFNDLKINNNPLLLNIDGLSNLTQIIGDFLTLGRRSSLEIKNNSSLMNLDGLSSLGRITDGDLVILSNGTLTNIDGLSNLELVGQEVFISGNHQLANLDGLSSLEKIARLIIQQNNTLTNLDGLSALILVVTSINIQFNPLLTDFCGLSNLFSNGEIGGSILIRSNGANTVGLSPPLGITVNNDAGFCSAVIPAATIGTATPVGCLEDFTVLHTDFPVGNVFPVGVTNIKWTVTDGAGNTATSVQTITVIDNQVPVIICPGNITVKCASDVPDADISSVTASDNCSAIIAHDGDIISNQTCENRFTLTRTYTATDPAGNTAKCVQVITVNDDVPPQLTGLSVSREVLWPPNHKMQDITVSYTATDNCVGSPIVTITVDSNEPVNGTADGDTDPDWEIIDNYHVKLRAERAANGDGRTYTITVTVDDGCNPPVSSRKQVIVAHNITAPQSGKPFKVGSTVAFSGEFWDKPGNSHTAKWLLDGSAVASGIVSEPAGNQKGKVTGSYKFRSAGVYKLQMNVTDQNGITSYANTNEDVDAIVVIYDPNGGYTYGGGYYNSPPGALVSNPSATGKASYGFAMNYFKNSTYPKGETQFEFKVGDFEFNALNFEYLVISNSMAQFKGTGKIIGGQSGIGFTMTVVDGQLDGTGVDKIRMKIYNKNNGLIIYDNQSGAGDAAMPTQAVGTNSTIVISGTNSSLTSANTNQKGEMEAKVAEDSNGLDIIAFPNPGANNFTINVKGITKEKIAMQVVDMYGRVIETRNVSVNSNIRFGDRYRPGTYFVRIIQGKEHKEMKLIKLSD